MVVYMYTACKERVLLFVVYMHFPLHLMLLPYFYLSTTCSSSGKEPPLRRNYQRSFLCSSPDGRNFGSNVRVIYQKKNSSEAQNSGGIGSSNVRFEGWLGQISWRSDDCHHHVKRPQFSVFIKVHVLAFRIWCPNPNLLLWPISSLSSDSQ